MARVLITGAAGFTGMHLARCLAAAGHRVCGLGQGTPAVLPEALADYRVCDLADVEGMTRVLGEVAPDHVVHLAAVAFVAHAKVDEMYRTNLLGTRNLLEAIVRSGVQPRSVLVASSANVYGNATAGKLDEATPLSPANDYAVSKVAMEYLAGTWRDRVPVILVRPFNYTGVGQSLQFLVPKIVDHVRRRAPVIELGNIEVSRDFSDVRTVVEYYRRLLVEPRAIGQVFNVCSGRGYTLRQVLSMCLDIAGHAMEIRVNPAFVRANEVKELLGDPSRIHACVGEPPAIALEETLRCMITANAAGT